MSYEKRTWVPGETITAAKLNYIERGIEEAAETGGAGGADWEAAEGEPGYIENKPYEVTVIPGGISMLYDDDVTLQELAPTYFMGNITLSGEVAEEATIHVNGTEYHATRTQYTNNTQCDYYYGSTSLTAYPFILSHFKNSNNYTIGYSSGSLHLAIEGDVIPDVATADVSDEFRTAVRSATGGVYVDKIVTPATRTVIYEGDLTGSETSAYGNVFYEAYLSDPDIASKCPDTLIITIDEDEYTVERNGTMYGTQSVLSFDGYPFLFNTGNGGTVATQQKQSYHLKIESETEGSVEYNVSDMFVDGVKHAGVSNLFVVQSYYDSGDSQRHPVQTAAQVTEAINAGKEVVYEYSETGGPSAEHIERLPLIGYSRLRVNGESPAAGDVLSDNPIAFGGFISNDRGTPIYVECTISYAYNTVNVTKTKLTIAADN